MSARSFLPDSHPLEDRAAPSNRSRVRSLVGTLLASLVLIAPLNACAPTLTAGDAEVAEEVRSADPGSEAPTGSPTAGTTKPASPPAPSPPPATAPSVEDPESAAPPTPAPEAQSPAAAEGTALAMLAGLEQKGRAPTTGYDRDSFGWREDVDRNGCDTRNDVLRRDLHEITLAAGTQGCVVLRGALASPYSGATIDFDRTDSTIDIDHVVALSDAWQTGAAGWDDDRKREFANDPMNLLAVEAGLNRQKGAGDAATWLPPAKDYRCEYVSLQIAVKDKYDLWVKPAEADAMERVLGDCEGFLAITGAEGWPGAGEGDVVGTGAQPTMEPASDPAPAPATAVEGSTSAGGNVHYKNCDAARAAGADPVRTGDPGYAKHLDRDGDGVGCE